jgi:hypothetical protein
MNGSACTVPACTVPLRSSDARVDGTCTQLRKGLHSNDE